jgi:integrase
MSDSTTKGPARGGRPPARAPIPGGREGAQIRAKGYGTHEFRNGHHWVKVSLPNKTRPRYRLCLEICTCAEMSDAMIAERCQAVSERVRREVAATLATNAKEQRERRLTVQKFGELWTSGKLFEQHGELNGLRSKATADDDRYRLGRYVYPVIGPKLVAAVTEEDIERVMREAPRRARVRKNKRALRPASKFQLYQLLRRFFDLAIMPGRLRSASPVQRQIRPRKGGSKLFGYLYPSELLTVLKCSQVPIERRMLYALAVYTGLRKGSLYALTWAGVDFEHRTLASLKSKTGLPQLFEIPQSLAELLAAWFEHLGRPGPKSPVVPEPIERQEREAEILREDLMTAGIARHEPDPEAENVQALRFHDLRATFVTWAMREGRGDGWISDRTGHLTPEMRARYARAARTLADLQYEPFPDVSGAIPELLEARDNVRSLAAARARKAP